MQRIIYTRPDGGVSVVIPSGKVPFETVLQKDVPTDATNVQVVEDTTIPSDRTVRNAWVQQGKAVITDMTKARIIHTQRIREKRDKKLEVLDKDTMRFLNDPQKRADIETQKQALRDLPQNLMADIQNAMSPETLKQVGKDFLAS